jgi:hypothetical protein
MAMVNPDVNVRPLSTSPGSDGNLGSEFGKNQRDQRTQVTAASPTAPTLATTDPISPLLSIRNGTQQKNKDDSDGALKLYNEVKECKRKADEAFAALLLKPSEETKLVYGNLMVELEKAKLVQSFKLSDQVVTDPLNPPTLSAQRY